MGYVFEFEDNVPDYRPRAEDDDDALFRVEERIRAERAKTSGRAAADTMEIFVMEDWEDNGDGSRQCTLGGDDYSELGTLFWYPAKLNTVHVRT